MTTRPPRPATDRTATPTTRGGGRPLRRSLAAAAALLCLPALAVAAPDRSDPAADLAALARADGGRAQVAAPARTRAVTNVAAWPDAPGDNEGGLAPDIQAVGASSSDDGRFTVGVRLDTNALVEGDFVAVYVDADGNPGTGNPVFLGADVVFTLLGVTGGTDVADVHRWDGVGWVPAAVPSFVSFTSGADEEYFSVRAAEIGVAQGTAVGLYVGSLYTGIYDSYADFAPEPGSAPFRFTAGAFAPPPPPPPAPVVTPPAPTGGTVPPVPGGAVTAVPVASPRPLVLRTLGLSRSGTRLRVRFAFAGGSGRVLSQVSVSAVVGGSRRERFLRLTSPPGARTVTRTLALPRTWAGARVRVQLVIGDDYRDLSRTRTITLGAAPRRALS